MNGKVLGVILAIASALDAAMLTTTVEGFAITPAARYWLTIAQAGIAAALLLTPGLMQTRDGALDLRHQDEHAPE